MNRGLSLVGICLLSQPTWAAAPFPVAKLNRQLSEIVFQNYPSRALAAGEEGPVFFTVTLDKDAHPMACQVTHGSGHPLLDEETCDLILKHAVFGSAQGPDGRLTRETAEGVVNWTIPGHQPTPINTSVRATNALPDKQICKKVTKTGTLSGVERTCMTSVEWARQSDDSKRPYEELQGRKGFSREDQETFCSGTRC